MTTPPIAPTTNGTTADQREAERTAALHEQLDGVPASEPPAATKRPQRDAAGRWREGWEGGPGRRAGRGWDLRALAERESKAAGVDLDKAMWRVLLKVAAMAEAGDLVAARLLFDKLGIVEDAQQTGGVSVTVITGIDSQGSPVRGIDVCVSRPKLVVEEGRQ